MAEIIPRGLPGVVEIRPQRIVDDRGYLCEIFRKDRLREVGFADVAQVNHSLSHVAGTLRGLHFQAPPAAQAKLVRAVRGSLRDVFVDLRIGSPTFGQWRSVVLSASTGNQVLVPVGFGHGFVTLEPDTEIEYLLSAYYAPQHDRGLRWDDPDLAIDWGLGDRRPIISDKDQGLPLLRETQSPFHFSSAPVPASADRQEVS